MMTAIGQTEIDGMIIDGMIAIMITDEMMIVATIIEGIIVTGMTVIIHQEMIEMTGGHTRVIGITMIEEGMMITKDITMIVGRTIEDLKDLDSFNIIRRVEIILNPKMFDNHNMKREKRMNQRCRTAIRVITNQRSLCKSMANKRQRKNIGGKNGHGRRATS